MGSISKVSLSVCEEAGVWQEIKQVANRHGQIAVSGEKNRLESADQF